MSIILTYILFFTIFIGGYLGINAYIYFFIKQGLSLGNNATIVLKFTILFLALSFPLGTLLEKIAPNTIPFILTLLGSIWMGLITIAISLAFIMQISFLILDKLPFSINIYNLRFILTITIIIVSIGSSIFALFNAGRSPIVNYITIPSKKLNRKSIKILHLSDIHAGTLIGKRRINQIINQSRKTNPDCIVITGDIIDADIGRLNPLIPTFKELTEIAPVFAIVGNHEFYAGIKKIEKLCRDSGITLLRNEVKTFDNSIDFIALDDEESGRFEGKRPALESIFKQSDSLRPIIFLNHRPTYFHKAAELGALVQLSGHTHSGQIFPGNLFVKLFFKYTKGFHKYKNSYIYVNSGAGTWGPPMRLCSKSEIALIEIKRLKGVGKRDLS